MYSLYVLAAREIFEKINEKIKNNEKNKGSSMNADMNNKNNKNMNINKKTNDISNDSKNSRDKKDVVLFVSCFEIYGGKLYDLLNDRNQIKCLEDAKQQVCSVRSVFVCCLFVLFMYFVCLFVCLFIYLFLFHLFIYLFLISFCFCYFGTYLEFTIFIF